MYRKTLDSSVSILPDGGNRIACVRIDMAQPLVLICAYLPTRGNSYSRDDYQSVLDELSEIIQKYSPSAKILIGGDMNASVHRGNIIYRDMDFSKFLTEHNLSIPTCCKANFTFHHFNGRDKSQIDYFIENTNLITSYITFSREATNTSTHDPILVTIPFTFQNVPSPKKCVIKPKLKWEKMDLELYEEHLITILKDELDISENLDPENVNNLIEKLCEKIVRTAQELNPVKPNIKRVSRTRPWSPEISEIVKVLKTYYWRWKQEGKPKHPESETYTTLKKCKKQLRATQRKQEAQRRQDNLSKIMELRETDEKEFYQMIRRQRQSETSSTTVIRTDGTPATTPDEITNTWADYFQKLATPSEDINFCNDFQEIVNDDVDTLTQIFEKDRNPIPSVTVNEVLKCIKSFKNGKAADEQGVCIEHIKYGGLATAQIITNIVNHIFEHATLPNILRNGISYPIYKKGGKPKDDPNSYRKITVTSTLGKIVEKLHLARNKDTITEKQSCLQKGFTEGESPSIAGLIITELKIEAKETKKPLLIALTDAQKAFDVVWHNGLMREMYKIGVTNDNWLLFQDWYNKLSSKIKWQGLLSREIKESQGLRQGGVWSPTAYKVFVNSLLTTFEENRLGAHLGSIFCGIPTVADDVTLVSNDANELQVMLNVQSAFANKQRFIISSQKSCVIASKLDKDQSWNINGQILQTPRSATHLGIQRDNHSAYGVKEVVPGRVQVARRTVYALMGAGLYGLNGLNPKASIHIVRCYVLPRLLYGLEVIRLTKSDITQLSTYFIKLLKQLQHLPERTANVAALLLLGQLPLESEIHKRILNLFGNIIRNYGSIERDIAIRQLAVKSRTSDSWFIKIVELTELYSLPSPYDLIESPPSKHVWKQLVKKSVHSFWIDHMKTEVKTKSTLQYICLDNIETGHVHNIWESCGSETFAITKACVKSKIATGTYTLQLHKAKFSRNCLVSSTCLLCGKEPEDIKHFLIRCSVLQQDRQYFFDILRDKLQSFTSLELCSAVFNSEDSLLQLIIDSSNFRFCENRHRLELESVTRGLCYRLHQRRSCVLS